MQFTRDIQFKNWTTEDFTYKYGNEDYTFKAGATYNVPSDIAVHFAKHLAIKQLHTEGKDTLLEGEMNDYQAKCFPGGAVADKLSATGFERVDIKDEKATEVKAPQEALTPKDVQSDKSEDDDADVSDEKNNAGAPKFKVSPKGSKDKAYVK